MAVPATAESQTISVDDPILDTVEISGPGSTPAYFDIVGGEFEFSMEIAVPVPNEPLLP